MKPIIFNIERAVKSMSKETGVKPEIIMTLSSSIALHFVGDTVRKLINNFKLNKPESKYLKRRLDAANALMKDVTNGKDIRDYPFKESVQIKKNQELTKIKESVINLIKQNQSLSI